jgi:hypothetical protein
VLPLSYAAGGVVLIAILFARSPAATWPAYAIVAAGVPVYAFWRRARRRRAEAPA